jgi:hypothetical protein
MFDIIGRQDPPPITHPAFYYGFVGVGLAWQVAFLIIATNPTRFRPLMVAGMIEKFSYGTALRCSFSAAPVARVRPHLWRRRLAVRSIVCVRVRADKAQA